ncbi:MAG: hypothetical protein A2275_08515 [Bacteroidetes bacterium RIFOXYA12_FULL_35_11]|nr:MAG: hypothetical protein A2X01_09330 [Bacteroidetes bacterium GWF2_35_48]OFY75971.1 MAG: hypothetical protein A2275_08515 [Bacteroidetes bacterium RIFOXYA12_FULL_35_11]OFY93590.1 MAG: hypothetical protein A2491_00975 [Bacteroidetes bacterium RIFOXYC12_FULL_35_7]HBX53676.1 hypothetical protein [Bacteroidales bacterium]
MKTINFIILLVMGFSYIADAQQPFLGGRVGYGYTRLNNKYIAEQPDSVQQYVSSFGTNFGVGGGFYFTDRFCLKTELVFNNIQQRYEGDIMGGYKSLTDVKTLDIPILFSFGKWVYIEAGPVFNFVLKASFNSTIDSLDQKNITDKYNRINYGAMLGGGFALHAGDILVLYGGLRGFVGLKDYGNGVDALGEEIHDYKTTSWGIGAVAGINIKIP